MAQTNLNKLFGHTLKVETIAPSGDGTVGTPTKILVKEDTGTTYFCDIQSGDAVFQLPAPVAGAPRRGSYGSATRCRRKRYKTGGLRLHQLPSSYTYAALFVMVCPVSSYNTVYHL